MTPTASTMDLRYQATPPSPQRQQMVAAEAAAVSTILSAQPAAPSFAVAAGGNPPIPIFRFGEKHRNKDYEQVTEQEPGYFFWGHVFRRQQRTCRYTQAAGTHSRGTG